uniref:Uncharacterized protein n=1 Tax=Anopheles funestus TaxID=62324 RepID=A0A182RMS4_ANOFN
MTIGEMMLVTHQLGSHNTPIVVGVIHLVLVAVVAVVAAAAATATVVVVAVVVVVVVMVTVVVRVVDNRLSGLADNQPPVLLLLLQPMLLLFPMVFRVPLVWRYWLQLPIFLLLRTTIPLRELPRITRIIADMVPFWVHVPGRKMAHLDIIHGPQILTLPPRLPVDSGHHHTERRPPVLAASFLLPTQPARRPV